MKPHRTTRCLVVTLAVAAIGLTLSACGRGEDSAAAGKDSRTVFLAVSTLNNPFFLELRDGAQQAADKAGVELQVADAHSDAATQANQLANAASQGVDAVVLNPVDSEAAGPAVAPLTNAGIPVVGGIGQIVALQGVAGTSASRERGQGFTEGLSAFPDIEVVASQPANFDRAQALDVATNLLQGSPDVVGVFAENDEMALGAVQALGARAGSEVQVVGFDGNPDGLTAVQDGTLTAAVAQLPAKLGATAVTQAVAVLDGESAPADVPFQATLVDSTNVEEFIS